MKQMGGKEVAIAQLFSVNGYAPMSHDCHQCLLSSALVWPNRLCLTKSNKLHQKCMCLSKQRSRRQSKTVENWTGVWRIAESRWKELHLKNYCKISERFMQGMCREERMGSHGGTHIYLSVSFSSSPPCYFPFPSHFLLSSALVSSPFFSILK